VFLGVFDRCSVHKLSCCAVLRCALLQVFVCFKMLLTSSGLLPAQVDGCLMHVFNIQGYITHMVLFRSGLRGCGWGGGGIRPTQNV